MYVRCVEIVEADRLAEWSTVDTACLDDQGLMTALAAVADAKNVLAGLEQRLLAQIDRRDLAGKLGASSTAAWLAESARTNPGAARRAVETARGLETLPMAAEAARTGEISDAHATAIVAAMAAIETACPQLDSADRARAEERLVQAAVDGNPAAVDREGRELLLRLRGRDETAAEDTDRNRLDIGRTRNGRTVIRADVDSLTGDMLRTALSPLSKPRPAENGVRDERSPSQRAADGFTDLLSGWLGAGIGPGEGGVKPHVVLTTRASDLAAGAASRDMETPWPFHLDWTGAVCADVARMLACDCRITSIIVDGNEVPLRMGRTERLALPHIRRALVVRDKSCVGCGRPAAWCQAHHIVHWADGGTTDLDNLVLLCGQCHRRIHRGDIEIVLGEDRHPRIVRPRWIDKHRRSAAA